MNTPLLGRDLPSVSSIPPAPRATTEMAGFDSIFRLLMVQKWVVLAVMASVVALGVLHLGTAEPQYLATVEVLIDPRKNDVMSEASVLSDVKIDSEVIASEVQVLTSRDLIRKLVTNENLVTDPEFNPTLAGAERGLFASVIRGLKRTLIAGVPTAADDAAQKRERATVTTIDTVLDKLEVRPSGTSNVIDIKFSSRSPRRAAEIANKLAELYLVEQLEVEFDAAKRTSEWLQQRVDEMRGRVANAEKKVLDYRANHGLVEGTRSNILNQQIEDLTSRLAQAQAATSQSEARMGASRAIENGDFESAGVSAVLESPLVQRLRQDLVTLEADRANLRAQFGPQHPKSQAIDAEIKRLQGQLSDEARKVVRSVENDARAARASENALRRSINQLKSQLTGVSTSEVGAASLDRDAQAQRNILTTLLSQQATTLQAAQMNHQTNARIISRADVPQMPFSPNVPLTLLLSLVSGALLGIGFATVRDKMDNSFHSLTEATEELGVRALGMVPMAEHKFLERLARPNVLRMMIEKPFSVLSEGVRSVLSPLMFEIRDQKNFSLIVTSSEPGEGKTVFSSMLASQFAMHGRRVILVDCDLRRGALHETFDIVNDVGFSQVLQGTVDLQSVKHRIAEPGLDVIPCGPMTGDPHVLLNSSGCAEIVDRLKSEYDIVIFDTPPLMAVSDALALSRLVNATVFGIRWGKTRKQAVAYSLRLLRDAGARLAGVVLLEVNLRANSVYGYGDSYSYYGKSKKYYTS